MPACDPGPSGGKGLQRPDFTDPICGGGGMALARLCDLGSGILPNHASYPNTGFMNNRCCNPLPFGMTSVDFEPEHILFDEQPAARSFLGEFARPGKLTFGSHTVAFTHDWDVNFGEPAAGSFLGEIARQGMEETFSSKQMFLVRWLADRIFVGLRLFLRCRGRNCLGLAFLWLCGRILTSDLDEDGDVVQFYLFPFAVALVTFVNAVSTFAICCFERMRSVSVARRFLLFRNLSVLHPFAKGPRARTCTVYVKAVCVLGLYLLIAAFLGCVVGIVSQSCCSYVCLWRQLAFDSTLGYPGEGPVCSSCQGDTSWCICNRKSGNDRLGPYARGTGSVLDDLPASIQVRNTFLEVSTDNGSAPSRSLRRNQTDPPIPSVQSLNAAEQEANSLASSLADANIGTGQGPPRNHTVSQAGGLPTSASASASSHARMYCPVTTCPAHDTVRSAGWSDVRELRKHLQEHVCGRLAGDVPLETLSSLNLDICSVCSKLLSRRFGGTCPSCRPDLAAPAMEIDSGRPLPSD